MPRTSCPFVRRFALLARRAGDAPALLGPEGELLATRASLVSAASQLEDRIAHHVAPGATVVLSLPNSTALVKAFIALRALDARVALVDSASPGEELALCAHTVDAAALLATPERLPTDTLAWSDGATGLTTRGSGRGVTSWPDAAVFKFTSGSTGTPRAVALNARQLVADVVQIMRTMEIAPDYVTLAAVPLTHSYGLSQCLLPLLLTGTPLAFPTCALPAALAMTLSRARVAHFPAVPAMIRALATLPGLPPFPELRVCLAAGAPLQPVDAAAFHSATGHKVHVFYGSSECGGITYDRTHTQVDAPGNVGTPMHRTSVEVIDADGRPVAPGQVGRVLVRSLATALGAVPPLDDPNVLQPGRFLTGDLGRLDERGNLVLTGRVAELLNIAGKKVHPEEVRRVLEAVPGVRNAVVTGLPDRHRGEIVGAVVAVDRTSGLTVHKLLTACRARLAPHKVPRRMVLVDDLPVSERGKLRKDVVMQLLAGENRL